MYLWLLTSVLSLSGTTLASKLKSHRPCLHGHMYTAKVCLYSHAFGFIVHLLVE